MLNRLAEPADRPEAAARLAAQLGAEAALILIRDHELGVLRPAPGFVPATLPGGPAWHSFVAQCAPGGVLSGTISFPDAHTLTPFHAIAGTSGDTLMLFGGSPQLRADELDEAGFPLLCALLRAESVSADSEGLAREARDASGRAVALAHSLDAARSEIAHKANALEHALAEAERLNTALNQLNATLEQRVAEQTRELAAEMEQRRTAEAALAQVQKMEAIGHLTGGIAHDFNNLLTVILGGVETIERAVAPDNVRALRAARNAAKAARSAATLTSRLLAFSRRQPLDPRPTDINALIRDMTNLLHRTLGEQVELEGVLTARLWTAEVDVNQLENAILNLAVNARDAMPDGGKLTLETRNTYLDEAYAAQFPEVRPGQYVEICVSDTGTGIPPELLERVFEPFFTTKDTGKGTGLGLSQVYGFLKQSGGHVRVYSEIGRGTTVRLYLPRASGPARPARTETADQAPRGCGETILVVEDEPLVRAHSCDVLRGLGYRVLEAADGDEAMDIVGRGEKLDLLFTDVVLPGRRSGRQLADDVLLAAPQVAVLFTTGYARNAIVHHGRLDAGVQLVTKPFTIGQLAARVRALLDEQGRARRDGDDPDVVQ